MKRFVFFAGMVLSCLAAYLTLTQSDAWAEESFAATIKVLEELREQHSPLLHGGKGILVTQIVSNSQAEKAGIMAGDTIVLYDEKPVDTASQFITMVQSIKQQTQSVNIGVVRGQSFKSFPLRSGQVGVELHDVDAVSTEPILRLETGMHMAGISRIGVDAAGRWLVSSSKDKVLRVWSLPELKLVQTLRVPIGDGNEGELYSTAISPDGSLIAAGGWTGSDWDATDSIYLFNRATGALKHRISGLGDVIHHLAFSPDGRYLAASLGGGKGLSVWRTLDWSQVAQDSDYGDRSGWVDFAADGRLVTTSDDGYLHLYDADFKLIRKSRAPGGKHPFAAVFSPDGRSIAVGFTDSTVVNVLNGKNLSRRYSPDTGGVDNGNLGNVAWSVDGENLYAGGVWNVSGDSNGLRRWSKAGRGSYRDLPVSGNTIRDIRSLPGGAMVVGAADPALTLLDRDGSIQRQMLAEIADYRGNQDGILLSRDGSRVKFGFEYRGKRPASFDLVSRSLSEPSDATDGLRAPDTTSLKISEWHATTHPQLNGRPLKLEQLGMSRSVAIAPDHQSFLLGAEWSLRRFDASGRELWRVQVPGIAWAVNVSGDGSKAVAAFGDGTIRWYNYQTGKELLAFFPHKDGKRWIMWTPDGYYDASPHGDDLIGWHINRGKDHEANFYSAKQFERILYRPDYVQAYFKYSGKIPAGDPVLKTATFDIRKLDAIAPPKIEISVLEDYGKVTYKRLKIIADKKSIPMQSYTVFVNDIPVTRGSNRVLKGDEQQQFERIVDVPLFDEKNDIRVEVFNGKSMGLQTLHINHSGKMLAKLKKGDLYLLAVGVNSFINMPESNLRYAAQDAEGLATELGGLGGAAFNKIHLSTLSDQSEKKPTRANIRDALSFIQQAQPEDTVVLFLASHGISDNAGNYYFVPSDASPKDVASVIGSSTRGISIVPKEDGDATFPSLVSWEAFFDALRSTVGRRLLIVDTCQAKNIEGTLDFHALSKRSATSSFAVMAASKGNEESQEYGEGKHGLFTYALIQGLSGQGDLDKDGKVSLSEIYTYTSNFVSTNRNRNIGSQTPQLEAPDSLQKMTLSNVRAGT